MALVDLASGALVTDPAEVATVLEPNADGATLAAAAAGNAGPVAIRFPVSPCCCASGTASAAKSARSAI